MKNTTTLTHQDILDTIRAAGQDIADTVDWGAVQGGDYLATDLGFDSLMMLLFSIRIEDAFGVSIPNSVQLHTVDDVCAYIMAHLPATTKSE